MNYNFYIILIKVSPTQVKNRKSYQYRLSKFKISKLLENTGKKYRCNIGVKFIELIIKFLLIRFENRYYLIMNFNFQY